MELSINTPALLFPAITLLLLAYTNRFLALANLIRKLHDEYVNGKKSKIILFQINNLRKRIHFIRRMQALGVFSFLCCVVCMYCIYRNWNVPAGWVFGLSLLSLLASLLFSLAEIFISTKALELQIGDIEELEKTGFLSGFLPGSVEKKE
jgi:hypothetical protein